jgi:CubicO group peptidase (beta-lactamase class C family)
VGEVPQIVGTCEERFAAVREAMEANFRERGEIGAAVAVELEGRPVVDLWGGWMDLARTRPWQRDTLVDVFSVGKAMAAICLLALVERGEVELDAPVGRYWPRFARNGKEAVTVRMLLSHRAGLPAIRRLLPGEAMCDWELMVGALADEEPWWEPGTTHGYHVNTFGFLVGELVRRASGTTIGSFLAGEIAQPLGADFHFGIGPEHDERIAEFSFGVDPAAQSEEEAEEALAEGSRIPLDDARRFLLARAYMNPAGLSGIGTVNTREWRAAEIPSANGHATARAVARIYSALAAGGEVDGVRVLKPETLEQATAEASAGVDFVLGRPSRFALGFQLTQPERPLGPKERSFGHFGAGGSLGFADPEARLAFGYVLNHSGPRWQNPRNKALLDAVYACL